MNDRGDVGNDPVAILERIRELETELAELVRRVSPNNNDDQVGRFHALELDVGPSRYLVPIDPIEEVVPMAWPNPLTGSPEWVMGTINYGSQVVALIDLGLRLESVPTVPNEKHSVVIVSGRKWIGLVVPGVGEVREIEGSKLATPGTDIPCAPFLLGTHQESEGAAIGLLSLKRLSRDLDG